MFSVILTGAEPRPWYPAARLPCFFSLVTLLQKMQADSSFHESLGYCHSDISIVLSTLASLFPSPCHGDLETGHMSWVNHGTCAIAPWYVGTLV